MIGSQLLKCQRQLKELNVTDNRINECSDKTFYLFLLNRYIFEDEVKTFRADIEYFWTNVFSNCSESQIQT